MKTPATNAAIRFEPDAFMLSGPQLMGRQAAGNAFLRAAVASRSGEPLWAYTPHRRSAEIFERLVHETDPAAETRWLPADRLDLLGRVGTLYWPAPGLGDAARLRLRAGPAAYSLCGVTHTTASHVAMDGIIGMLTAPVMPWDAVICTSGAVAETVKILLEGEADYLRWRCGPSLSITMPRLPVIPLGVHTADFVFAAEARAAARRNLAIADDEVVALFLGRLSFHAKAHPHAMYLGLQATAERTKQKLTLIQCGWFANASIEAAFRDGAARTCPNVRMLFTDGKDPQARRQSWSAADLFISLADNIQETFGLTPIEAMAAGLPVVVTDWNGYKDTVRDGIDGFRIPTWMPSPGFGKTFARVYESGTISYDLYCGFTCQTVSFDLRVLTERLSELVLHPDLRRRLGEAARARARTLFDWAVVYRQYQELWAELGEARLAAQQDPERQASLRAAPRAAPGRMDPFVDFGHYPTAAIEGTTLVSKAPQADGKSYRELIAHPLFTYAAQHLPASVLTDEVLGAIGSQSLTVSALAERTGIDVGELLRAFAVLAKMGLVQLQTS